MLGIQLGGKDILEWNYNVRSKNSAVGLKQNLYKIAMQITLECKDLKTLVQVQIQMLDAWEIYPDTIHLLDRI